MKQKQHITVEQINELSEKEKSMLFRLIYGKNSNLETLNIGEMIEVISRFVYDIEVFMGHGYWYALVKITHDSGENEYKGEFLVDALWNCLKDILKRVANDDGQ